MTKNDLVEMLLAKGFSEEELNGKKLSELKELYSITVESEQATDQNETFTDDETVFDFVTQLKIYEPFIVSPTGVENLIIIENLGGGDLYVGKGQKSFARDAKIAPDELKEFDTSSLLVLCAASRPIVRIRHIRR